MTLGIAHLQPIVSLLAGILILIIPRSQLHRRNLLDHIWNSRPRVGSLMQLRG